LQSAISGRLVIAQHFSAGKKSYEASVVREADG